MIKKTVSQQVEQKYTEQMRELVLKITSDIDCTVYLFGSRARNQHRRNSDIDIGFSGIDEALFIRVRDRLLAALEESIIPHHTDIVHFDTASQAFKEIAMTGAIIWKQSSHAN
jgi:uncharacterized protein